MKRLERGSGILLGITSLPSPYGIGTMGQAAYDFVDFLVRAKQKYWQILPVGPTSYGDSPYASFSSFAGNPYLIDLDMLIADGLLEQSDVKGSWGKSVSCVDYGLLYKKRFEVLRKAAENGLAREDAGFGAFVEENKHWLREYALYMAVKDHFGSGPWIEWPDEDIRLHRPEACARYADMLKDDIRFYEYIQYLFFSQWHKLRSYANEHGVKIIGDIPIYVPLDSADVWSEPEWFQLDSDNRPIWISGVPPDYFNENGQLWGNPIYDWDRMREDGFGWWIRRIGGAEKLYDVLRIDHFRGFESYWAVPADAETAKEGHWVKGPGVDVIHRLTGWFKNMTFIAEDLGFQTPEIKQFVEDSGLPGMKVLEFAFDAREPSNYLPHLYNNHCTCYTGTHDNETLLQWKEQAAAEDIEVAVKYLGLNEKEGFVWGIVRGGMSSVADLFIAQMQDYLELGAEGRMNVPGNPAGNWCWRMKKNGASAKLADKIADMTVLYGRS
ncbi:MAG: 4-alpha-glucanotransferase [Lachnospiraceae bacterium]|nr:4-alpha-glucanotransferase [Lachnospiraceae bacterium]